MSRPDALQGDMANDLVSFPGDGPQWDGPLEAVLSGQPLPEDAGAELRGVSELLTALRAEPSGPVWWLGQDRALDAYRRTFALSHPSQPPRRRPAMNSSLLGARFGAALAVGVVSFGGVTAAAYTGALPSGLQDLANTTIGAPAADRDETDEPAETAELAEIPDPGETAKEKAANGTNAAAVGPDATGSAAFGLCTAWAHVQDASGQAGDKSVAFRNLTTAAGTTAGIPAYCATIPHPGSGKLADESTETSDEAKSHATGKPSGDTTGRANGHASDKAANHPTGKPAGR